MPTDTDKTLNGTPEPFRRPIVWGRPPATVFRAGPLPKGGGLPPLPEPPRQPTPGILTGSMIPRAAPAAAPALAQAAVPSMARAPEPHEEPASPYVPAGTVPTPDLTVRPLPMAEPEPVRPPEPGRTPVQPVAVKAQAAAIPVQPVSAARKSPSRTPLYAGIALAAVTVLALGGWIWTRSPVETPAPTVVAAPAPAVPATEILLPESLPTPVPVTEPAAEAPPSEVAVPPARPTATAATPARTPPPPTARPASPAPEVVAPPPAVTTAPLIEIVPAPVPGPAPTEAERPSTDPDAPIATRPQPIG